MEYVFLSSSCEYPRTIVAFCLYHRTVASATEEKRALWDRIIRNEHAALFVASCSNEKSRGETRMRHPHREREVVKLIP